MRVRVKCLRIGGYASPALSVPFGATVDVDLTAEQVAAVGRVAGMTVTPLGDEPPAKRTKPRSAPRTKGT